MKTNFLILQRDIDWGGVAASAGADAAMGSTFGPWGTAAGAIIGAGSALLGSSQKKQGTRMLGANPYPQMDVPQAEKDNQQIAAQMANEGLPSQQYALAMKNIQRQQQTALRQASDRRAGVGLIGQINQQTMDQQAKLDAENAQARLNNKRALLGVNNRVAGYQQAAFDWNQKNRYNQNYNYGMNLQGAGNANIIHGIDILGSAAVKYFGNGGRIGSGLLSDNGSATPPATPYNIDGQPRVSGRYSNPYDINPVSNY